jgi:hypothetical protein
LKILALGALWVPYIRDNWFDAIRRTLGVQAVCVNAGPLLAGTATHAGQPEGYHSAYIYDLLRRDRFDYLFFYHDWIFGDYPDAFFDKVRRAGVKTVAFHPDDEPEHWYARNSTYDHHFDVVASHSSAAVARRREAGWGERVMYLPWGHNPRTCYAVPGSPKRYDVVFIGKHKVNDKQGKVHVEDGAQREQILVRLAEDCERRGWTFRVFGYGWELHPQLNRYAGGMLSQEGMNQVLNESKVVFNPAWSSDGNPNAVQTKLRHFEVPGCGAFQITNANPELAELFVPDEEIVFYGDDDELVSKVERFVADDAAREAIAVAGHARAMREHTLDHRVEALFGHTRKIFPPAAVAQVEPAVVHMLMLEDTATLKRWVDDPTQIPALPDDAAWIHVVAGNFKAIQTDYAMLQPFLQAFASRMLTVSTYIDFDGLAANPLQPKLIEGGGDILVDDIVLGDLEFDLLDTMGGDFVGTNMEGTARLLANYVVPRGRLNELLAAFATGTPEAIHQLSTIPTGRIVTEVLLSAPDGYEQRRLGVRNLEYARRLRTLLPRFGSQGRRVVLYGISGMGEVAMKVAEQIPGFEFAGVIDRSLSVELFNGIPVMQAEDIGTARPDVVILAAGSSGPSIHAAIQQYEAMVCILPLYDLNHPVWSVVLA